MGDCLAAKDMPTRRLHCTKRLCKAWPTSCNELVDHGLCIVAKVAKLGLPDGERAPAAGQGVAVLEAQDRRLVQRRVEDGDGLLAAVWTNGIERDQPAGASGASRGPLVPGLCSFSCNELIMLSASVQVQCTRWILAMTGRPGDSLAASQLVDQHMVPLVEGAPLRVLAAHPHLRTDYHCCISTKEEKFTF